VTIGRGSFVGAGATILAGVTVGPEAFVGAGALVNRDVASKTTVAGVPARAIG
jgi:acetyltransferase-like isoleucine patch superfamily enzyme